MNLQLLCVTSHVTVSFDSTNDWLYLDWRGDLTLANVQEGCLAVARCFLGRPYPRVLNSNMHVCSVAWNVPAWLASSFLPALSPAGVQHLAWVYAPTLRGRDMAYSAFARLPHVAICLFDDMEQAVAWLQHTQLRRHSASPLLPTDHAAQLHQLVHHLTQELAATPAAVG